MLYVQDSPLFSVMGEYEKKGEPVLRWTADLPLTETERLPLSRIPKTRLEDSLG